MLMTLCQTGQVIPRLNRSEIEKECVSKKVGVSNLTLDLLRFQARAILGIGNFLSICIIRSQGIESKILEVLSRSTFRMLLCQYLPRSSHARETLTTLEASSLLTPHHSLPILQQLPHNNAHTSRPPATRRAAVRRFQPL